MFAIDTNVLVLGLLLMFATLSSRLSARAGVPLLVVFIMVGMAAGSEGIGKIAFNNYNLAHAVGTVALILILFDGGLQTSWQSIRRTAAPAGLLATVGVVLTAGSVGALATVMLDIPIVYGLLFGSIVGSTDAAAVFAALRNGGLHLRPRLSATLETESGSNDPMAVLLTVGCIQYIRGEMTNPWQPVQFLVEQIAIGLLVGWAMGRIAVYLINRIRLSAAGLYPMMSLGAALLSFGAAAIWGGSGFLAVYVTGIILGNRRVVFQRGIFQFHDGAAWLGQISMFVVLGLLSLPSEVHRGWSTSLLLAGILVFVARPMAVLLCLLPFRYDWRELVFISWAGLKGAVPIVLGIYPLIFNVDDARPLFNVVFFVVLVSVAIQGWSLGIVARWLGVTVQAPSTPPVTVEVTSLQQIDADIVSYLVEPKARAAHQRIDQLGMTPDMVIAMIVRNAEMVVPKGNTVILPGDHVFVTLRPNARWLLDHVFSPKGSPLLPHPISGNTTLKELRASHGLSLPGDMEQTLSSFVREKLDRPAVRGDELYLGMIRLLVLDIDGHGNPRDVRVDLGSSTRNTSE